MLNIFKEGLKDYINPEEKALLPDGSYPMYMAFGDDEGPSVLFAELQRYYNGEKTAEQIITELSEEDQSTSTAFEKIVACRLEPYKDDSIQYWNFTGDNANEYGYIFLRGRP